MGDNKNLKVAGLVAIIVLAVAVLAVSVMKNVAPVKEEVVGHIDMGPGGGRNAEAGAAGSTPAGGAGQEEGQVVDMSKEGK